jgi:Protein of unknown function (DUF3499)
MTYDYGSRTAWVDDLAEVPSPAGYDLCASHARAFSVPQGWTRSDRRAGTVATAGDEVPVAAPS